MQKRIPYPFPCNLLEIALAAKPITGSIQERLRDLCICDLRSPHLAKSRPNGIIRIPAPCSMHLLTTNPFWKVHHQIKQASADHGIGRMLNSTAYHLASNRRLCSSRRIRQDSDTPGLQPDPHPCIPSNVFLRGKSLQEGA